MRVRSGWAIPVAAAAAAVATAEAGLGPVVLAGAAALAAELAAALVAACGRRGGRHRREHVLRGQAGAPSAVGCSPACRCWARCAAACSPLRSAAWTAGAGNQKVSGWSRAAAHGERDLHGRTECAVCSVGASSTPELAGESSNAPQPVSFRLPAEECLQAEGKAAMSLLWYVSKT